jgi:hypothetical protein
VPVAKRDCTGSVLLSLREGNLRLAEQDAYTLALTEKLASARIPRASARHDCIGSVLHSLREGNLRLAERDAYTMELLAGT